MGCYLWRYGSDLAANLTQVPVNSEWLVKSVRYVGYNVAVIPVVLFCVNHMGARKDAFTAGALAVPLVMDEIGPRIANDDWEVFRGREATPVARLAEGLTRARGDLRREIGRHRGVENKRTRAIDQKLAQVFRAADKRPRRGERFTACVDGCQNL